MSYFLAVGLTKDSVSDIHPPWRRVDEYLRGDYWANDEDRERVEVNVVNPAVDDEVADHTEENQRVYASRRPKQRQPRNAAKGFVGQRA